MTKDREQEIKDYLDTAILGWRKTLEDPDEDTFDDHTCRCYIDAFQSARISIFGELLR